MSNNIVSDDPTVETDHQEEVSDQQQNLFEKLGRIDSLDVESAKVLGRHGRASQALGWSAILQLAFQSVGVIYGDIGTSPLYVYASTFTDGIKHGDDILGVLSLIFYTITLIPLTKYVFIVLKANDNGEGGTFALYSLLCRYAKVGLIPSQQAEDADVSNFQLDLPSKRLERASKLKSMLENSKFAKIFLLVITMLGTSMVIGDGVLTPCISVLSAVGGIREAKSSLSDDTIVWTSIAILVCLFMVQRFGTDKVGYTFAPIICIWFAFIGGIGVYNFVKFDPTVVKAINPTYIVDYFKRNKKDAWVSLGGVVLAITGTEAMFADVGHFTVRSVQISMCTITYPALILAYTGQASFLRKHEDLVSDTFYKSIPNGIYWPMFVIAVAAAIIASQAMISGTFSIIQQSLALGCFPRVKVVHTSTKYEGQVYIPEINYLLMLACVGVTAGFRTTQKIGNAYGIAVVFVMTLTSSLLVLIMVMIWKTNILFIIAYVLVIGSVELFYLSSVLYKFDQGGYLPLAFAAFIITVMSIWNNVYRRKYHYELDHKVSPQKFKDITTNTDFSRIPGLAMFYSELVHGIPPIFKHYLENVSALHSVLVFVSIKSLPISKVPAEERFLFRRVEPRELYVFRCAARYGYTDVHNEGDGFENSLLERLKEFIKEDTLFNTGDHVRKEDNDGADEKDDIAFEHEENGGEIGSDVEMVEKAWEAGVVHLVGENEVIAGKGGGIGKKILINYAYNFIKRNLRQTDEVFEIPHKRLLKVGMTYEL
ncbi:ARABIDOPSIS THALIANA HIGH AFFINITY K+ TRANSPORTER 5, high affinity K+ transporter 5 [Hibiscus trionum]|uniref:Potassium transporter n=1 Tax=Hibiscus trionum TaxID=183268 RepID=A0A9W7ILI7_HIBTR|nr:ARABIDOPSIS THALIANA HIGH AFFINITY K+ TRANSPORTER 5, high affinity K+ transporter 5 [Hibiscus trionum]